MIIDQCLALSKKKVDVIISDIDQLKISGRSRLEINTTSLIYIQALDTDGNQFNLTNIYSLIQLTIEQSQKPNLFSIIYEPLSNPNHQTLAYRIEGQIIGRTNLRFDGQNIPSKTIEFEVYEKLRIEPEELNILPLSTVQLTIHGGSQSSDTTIQWSTNDTKIIDLELNNIFKSKQIGHAIIYAKSIGIDPLLGETVIYGEDLCQINVVQIHSIELHIPTKEILPNKFLPCTVLPFDQNRKSIMITDVFLHSLTFTWSISNTHLAQFRPIIGNLTSYMKTFVINIETLRTGHVNIDVRLTKHKILIHSSHDLTNSVNLIILDRFYLNNFDETRTILLAPNSRLHFYHIPNDIILELSTNINLHFDSKTNILTSNEQIDHDAILYMKYSGKKKDKTLRYSSIVGAYLVQIQPIHYLLIQSYLSQETSALFSSIPIDYKLPVSISFHDEFGRQFDSTSISLRTNSYRNDLLSFYTNNTQIYEVIPLKNGSNILTFHDNSNTLRAYLPIQSNSAFFLPKTSISPLKQSYYINDIICFESDINEDRWSGDDGMYIDSKYGIGQMIMDGERHLHLRIDGQTITSERFYVQIPNEIQLLKGNQDFLYDGDEGKIYSYPIVFGSSSSTSNLHGLCTRQGLEHAESIRVLRPTFECQLEFVQSSSQHPKASNLFRTQAIFDLDLMSWACQIISKSFDDSSTHQNSLRLIVQTPYQIKSNELIIPYQPRFQLSSTSSIYLSEEHPFNFIQVSTLPNNEKYLQIQSSDPSIIKINKNSTDPFLYNIELRHGATTNNLEQIYIDIKNTLTGQTQRVPIKIQKRFIDNPFGRIFASILLCASLALIIYGLANRKPSIPKATVSTPLVSRPNSSSPRVIHSPPTPKRHLLFDDHQTSAFDSPTTIQQHDQPIVRLYSAQDLRSRSIVNTPRSTTSNMTLPMTDDRDIRRGLQRLFE